MHSLTLQQLGHGMVLVYKRGETDVETYAIISIIVLAEQERRQERDAVKITWLKTCRGRCSIVISHHQPAAEFVPDEVIRSSGFSGETRVPCRS